LAFFSDEELLGIHGAIIESMVPQETFRTLGGMIPVVNGPERAAILCGMRAGAPPEAFQAFVASLRPKLEPEVWTELLALGPFLG